MGCFAYTCAISELPIEAGTPCKLIALNPSTVGLNVGACSFNTVYFPAMDGTYDDYGFLSNLQETPLHERIALHLGYPLGYPNTKALVTSLQHQELRAPTPYSNESVVVRYSLVRNDVWDAMLSIPTVNGVDTHVLDLAAKEGCELLLQAPAMRDPSSNAGSVIETLITAGRFSSSNSLRIASALWRYGLTEPLMLTNDYASFKHVFGYQLDSSCSPYSAAELAPLLVAWSLEGACATTLYQALRVIGEQIILDSNMSRLRKVWSCRNVCGPQHGDTAAHLLWAQKMVALATS